MRSKSKAILFVLAILLGMAGNAKAQVISSDPSHPAMQAHVGGVYVSKNYSYWSDPIYLTNTIAAASPATFPMTTAEVVLPDGGRIVPFFVGEVVTIGAGTTAENVTLTAVNGCFKGAPQGNCTISGNTSNAHGHGDLVTSSSAGIQEAMQDAANNGGALVYFERDCGPVTLSLVALTTTITNCTVPLSYLSMGGSGFVVTTITGPATYSVGTTTTTTSFLNLCSSLTAGTNCEAFTQAPISVKPAGGSIALTPVLITATTTIATAGVLHVKVYGYVQVQSNS